MEVTYCASPVLSIREFTMANRILTENLLRDDKLDVRFNYSALDCYRRHDAMAYDMISKFEHEYGTSHALCKETLRLYTSSYYYPKEFVNHFNTDTIIMSCTSQWFDYPFVVELLNGGYRLILGGSNFRLWRNAEYVTNLLLKMGVKQKYIKNLIIVRGLADLTTDFNKIIKDWKHCDITENDLSTVWDCETDYLQNIQGTIRSTLNIDMEEGGRNNFYNIIFMLNNHCFWGKCAFCGFTLQPKMNFDEGVEAERIARNIINTCKKYKGNKVYFTNDYFQFTEKNKQILKIINENGLNKINCYSGILMLNEKNIENYNKYGFKYLKIGMESATDFSLKMLNKGYGEAEIEKGFSNLKKYLNKDTELVLHVIVDSPHPNKEEVERNYSNILRWKRELVDAGIKTNVVASSYAIIKDINDHACIDNKFIRLCDFESSQAGRTKFIKELQKAFGEEIITMDAWDHHVSFNRYDEDGNVLPTDFELLSGKGIIEGIYEKDELFFGEK